MDFTGKKPKIHKTAYIAPSADLIGDVSVGQDSSIWFGTVIRADLNSIKIGKKTSIQDNSVLHVCEHSGVVVGDNVTVGHRVILHGCTIEDNCLIGMGCIVLDGAVVGKGSVVGAGAVVTSGLKIPPNSVVVGIPGKIIKETNKEQHDFIEKNAQDYVDTKNIYMKKKK